MGKTNDIALKVAMRRKDTMELRVKGYTYPMIAEKIKKMAANGELDYDLPEGYSEKIAWNDVKHELDTIVKETRETTEDFVSLELARLDKMLSSVYGLLDECEDDDPKIKLATIDRLLKIQERRAKLIGLDMPSKIKLEDWRSEIIGLIMSGQLSIEDVRKELPEVADEIINGIPEYRRTITVETRALEAPGKPVQDEDVAEGLYQ